ncbi:MAG: sulfatase-like hydrolase/transferase [Deltaproteobacteria bacterium]|nr:sulfatase-like hydrolase/transferase [Deltaproteobacteria bacterium]
MTTSSPSLCFQKIPQIAVFLFLLLGLPFFTESSAAESSARSVERPNILFVILDDVGIDQLKVFGYGGLTPPKTPNIDALANSSVRFRNVWSMPECSPSRAVFFTGRYPFRTNIYQAIGPNDLANSQVSPYEMTAPKVLKTRGYTSAMFGKFHLGGPENNPFGNGTPSALGFDFFYGYIGGLPGSIDTTAGGVATAGTYSCGFVTDATEGACRFSSGRCDENIGGQFPGKKCLERGGIFVPNTTCEAAADLPLSFDLQNAYYVSPIVINRSNGRVIELPLADPRARRYRSTLEVDAARDWIRSRPVGTPWMATLSFSADHTPIQCPPDKLLSRSSRRGNNSLDCSNSAEQRVISNHMIEAMDTELGRFLVETGFAKRSSTGQLSLTPKGANTMIIVAGDNGSLGPTAKAPFDPNRAKGTVYQTGVWVPVFVSGPFVRGKNRDVEHMVNIADIFELFGEIAGADVHKLVPRRIDSRAMLPYLQNPQHGSIRRQNFTQFGANIQANPYGNGPCVFSGTTCSQTPVSKSVCEDNGGVWWGEGADDPSTAGVGSAGVNNCCEVNEYLYNNSQPLVSILPLGTATRNEHYKLVKNTILDYDPDSQECANVSTVEFYEIDQAKTNPKIDRSGEELDLDALTPAQQAAYDSLAAGMNAVLNSEASCPGDGNIDGVVDQKDIKGWNRFVLKTEENLDDDSEYSSSVFDFNHDGLTDEDDLSIIQSNLGTRCP